MATSLVCLLLAESVDFVEMVSGYICLYIESEARDRNLFHFLKKDATLRCEIATKDQEDLFFLHAIFFVNQGSFINKL
jgi:hypothetical protein